MYVYLRIISQMLPEVHTKKKCDFLKFMINLKMCNEFFFYFFYFYLFL